MIRIYGRGLGVGLAAFVLHLLSAIAGVAQLIACTGANHSPAVAAPVAGTSPSPVLVPSVRSPPPPASASAPHLPPAAAEEAPDAASSSGDEDAAVLTLTDPEPRRPLPKAPYFIEVRGDGIDGIATRGCGKHKQPSVVYATRDDPAVLLICADGASDADPDVTIGIPYLRGVGLAESGHSQFAFQGEGYESRVQLTVRITKFGAPGKPLEGSYITEARSPDGSVTKTFFGRFRLQHLPDDPSVSFY